MDDNALKQVPKFKYLGSKITEYGENTGDIMRRIKEAKVVFIVSPCIFIYLLVFTNICTFIVIKILHKQSLM